MSHVTQDGNWQDALRHAIEARYGSIRGYARHLAGDDAPTEQVEARRRRIQKWLKTEGPTVPSQQSVQQLLRDGVEVQPSMFPRPSRDDLREARRSAADAIEFLRRAALMNSERLEELSALAIDLQSELDDVRTELRSLRNDLGALRSIRDHSSQA